MNRFARSFSPYLFWLAWGSVIAARAGHVQSPPAAQGTRDRPGVQSREIGVMKTERDLCKA